MKYRAEIDGLRAVAVVPVILFHAGFEMFSGGFIGVDVFFVISGYLITTILLEDIEKQRFSIVRFYERRVRRILPALFFIMFICLPFAWMWMLPSQIKDFSKSLLAVSFFLSNFLFMRESGYFAASAEEKPLLHTWSLAVEEQYYLIFPVFLLLVIRLGQIRVFWMIVALALLSLSLSEWGWRNYPSENFFFSPSRAWEIFAGSIAAFIVKKKGVRSSNTLSLIGLSAIMLAIFSYDQDTPSPSVYLLLPVIGVVLLILFASKDTFAAKLLSMKLFVGIGLISYSAYLWHQPLFAFARIRMLEPPSSLLMLTLSLVSLVLAIFSWQYVEKPFRGAEGRIKSKTSLFLIALAGMVAFSSLGAYWYFNDGFHNRFSKVLSGDVHHLEFYQYIDERSVDCEPKEIAEQAFKWGQFLRCKQTKPGDVDWVLLGDSHAEHLFIGLAESLPSKNIAFYILPGKPYISNKEYESIFNVLLHSNKPKTILLTMHYVAQLRKDNNLFEGFSATINNLKNAGHNVVIVGDIPRYEIHPEDCLYAENVAQSVSVCSLAKEDVLSQERVYHDILISLSKLYSVNYFSISDPLCNETKCSMVSGEEILYRDKHHLNIPGSILIGRHIAKLMHSYQ